MVAIVTGAGLGTERGSGNVLGARGQLGSALLGRGNEAVTVNAATGNLILSHQDEFLVGRGPDSAINRVYNSQGTFTDDNADNWALGIQRRLHSWSGTPNAAGATVTRRGADGTDIVYGYDVGRGLYVAKDGAGAYDTVQYLGHWIWTDGDSQVTETYDSGGVLINQTDRDGNYQSYQYTWHNGAWRLSRVQNSDGDFTDFTWSGNNLASITTSYTDTQTGTVKTLTRTRYAYDGSNRLAKVTVDLSPDDNSVADGRVYETTYGYDGANRVNSIAQTDGSLLTFTYDGSGRVTSFTQTVENGVTRTTTLAYGSGYTTITDAQGNATTLAFDAKGQLVRTTEAPPEVGGRARVTEFVYDNNGNLIETNEGLRSPNLLDNSGWAAEQRGTNLVDLSGWPSNPDSLPAGYATVPGWQNPIYYADEARWAKAIGPDGLPVAVIQTGQADANEEGGGNHTNAFSIDNCKTYEFSTYIQITELNKHRIYFGLWGNASVIDANSGEINPNPYFIATYPDAGSGLKVGHWYKVVAYVMPASSGNLTSWDDLGGIYDVGSGERVGAVHNYRWNDTQPAGAVADIRFFNYYDQDKQGYFTNYYKPEVHELNISGGPATVAGWQNWAVGETRWAPTKGPDAKPTWAIQAGQTAPSEDGGGNYSNFISVDKNKSYEFTYYFKFSSLDKHYAFFGLSGDAPVENLTSGSVDTNPYFYYPAPGTQAGKFIQDRWYKVVGYVLPQGATAVPADQLGGVYDTTTGAKVDSLFYNFRWSSSGAGTTAGVRFFNYYGDVNYGYSTYFGAPEIREAFRLGVTASGQAAYDAEQIVDRQTRRYDDNGDLIEQVDQMGNTARWTYGAQNQLLTETRYAAHDVDGAQFPGQPTGGMTTRYVYDSELHLRFAVSAEGRVTEYRYDAAGNRVAEISYAANSVSTAGLPESYSWSDQDFVNWVAGIADKSTATRTDTTYDFRGNVAMVTSYARVDVAGNGIPDEGTSRTFYVYDQFGSLLSKRSIAGSASPSGISLSEYNTSNLSVASAGTIAGKPANLYTVQANAQWTAVYKDFAAVEGEVVTYSFTVKGTASDTSASIGLYGSNSYWGSNDASIARVVSGPGSISQETGSLWNIGGLSTTQETRIEVTRVYRQSEGGGVYLYVDRPNGVRAGASLIISDPILSKAATAVETYAYDGMGRAIRFTDAKGGGTWTSYLDAQSRTVVTHANGLVQNNAYNRAGELLSAAEMRGGAFDAAYVNSDIATWSTNTTRTSAGLLDGAPATQLTIASGQTYGYSYTAIPVAAGDTITWTISLKALGNSTAHALGFWGGGTYWGSTNLSSARIISGPGSIAQHPSVGGYFDVSGLSATEATRVEITRTFLQAEYAYPHLYTQGATQSPGEGMIVSANSLVVTRAGANGGIAVNPSDFSIENWSLGSVTSTPAGTLGGAPAVQYTVAGSASGQSQQAVAPNYLDARAGDTVTASITLMGTATGNSAAFGIYGHTTDWGYTQDSAGIARIVSGPGTIVRGAGNGFWTVTGLTSIAETRIEITRTFLEDETASVRLYPDYPNGSVLGHSIIAGAPSITRTPGEISSFKYDAAGNVRIARDPGGYRTFYFYDNLHRKVGEVAADGAVTEYKYDAADRLIASVRYANAYSAAQIAGLYDSYGNPTAVTFATIKSQIGASADDRWEWSVYDQAGRLLETINGAGAVVAFEYDGAGRVVRTSRYANVLASGTVAGFKSSPPSSPVYPASYVGLDRVTRNFYDGDGLLVATLDAEYYLTEYLYDKAGRQVETIAYYAQPSATYVANGTLAQIKSTQPSHASDAHTYTIYDGRGLVAALIDGEGNVTRFAYDASGKVVQEVRGQQVAANTAYTLATLPAASGQLQVVNTVRDVLGRVTSQTEVVSGGNLTATLAYSWAGDTVVATDARGNATNRYYDARGRLVLEEVAVGSGTWASSRYEYDSRGNLVKAIDARGNASYNYYDARNRLVLAIDAEGYATRTAYTALGDVASVTRYYNRASGIGNVGAQPTVAADARDATTSFTYDIAGLVTSTTDATGASESYLYTAFGQRSQVTNKLGGVTGFSYDRRGSLYTTYDYAKDVRRNDGSQQASGTYRELYLYDARGNLTFKVDAYGLEERRDTSYVYDRANRLVSKQLPALLVFNPANETESTVTPTETYKYDTRGNLIEITDPAGGRTLFYYDEADRKIAEIDALGTHRTFTYDANGNLTVERTYGTATALPGTPGGAPPAPSGTPREVYYTYNKANRLIETRIPSVQIGQLVGSIYQRPVADIVTSYVYDMMGNLVRENDARGNDVFHYYDKAGREIGKVDQENFLTTWTRDAEGNVLEERRYATPVGTGVHETSDVPSIVAWTPASAADRITQFTYDKMGHRLTETRLAVAASTVSGNAVSTTAQNATIAYSYNALGEVLSKTEATGDRTDYTYDAFGRMTARIDPGFVDVDHGGAGVRPVTHLYYDANDNLVYERPSEYYSGSHARSNRYVYGAGGMLKSLIDTTGATHSYYYSIKGELLRDLVTTTRADGSAVTFYRDKSYDALGRVTAERSASQDAASGWQAGPDATTSYNAYGEVATKGIGGTITEQFTYDNAGRVVKSNAGDGVWKFFVYDANGNVTLTLTSSGVAHLGHWTLADALSQAVNNAPIDSTGFNQYYVNASVVVYDKRNLAVETYEPGRQIANAADVATTTAQTLATRRWYNAFGEVVQERSARGFDTNYAYNMMGRLIQVQAPTVTVGFEDGTSAQQRPTENYAYDISGRLVGSQNANGFWTTRLLLAGSGYGGGEALVTAEYRPDSTVWQTGYDVYGNARKLIDGMGRVTWQEYDLADRLTKVTKPSGLVEEYAYDALGRLTRHWNSANGVPIYGEPEIIGYGSYGEEIYGPPPVIGYAAFYELTDYDHQGRVVSTKNFAGDLTSYSYSWNGAAATANMGTFGAWTRTVSTIADRYSTSDGIVAATDTTDSLGRMIGRTDMGGRSYTYTYNAAGQLAGQASSAGQSIAYTYYNTGRLAVMADNAGTAGGYSSANIDGTYTYDADGNRTYEKLQGTTFYYDYEYGSSWSNTVTLQEGKGSYDAMGRLLTFTDAGASGNGTVSIANSYDAAGNVRRTVATHSTINNNQTLGAPVTDDYWYKYDGLNRMTLVKGSLVSGQIVRGNEIGRSLTYNAAGERATQTKTIEYYDPYSGYNSYDEQESYTYNADGLLTEVRIGEPASQVLRAQTTYDLAGRVTDYREFAGDGTTVQFNRFAISYDTRGNLLSETTTLRRVESDGYLYVSHAITGNTYAATGVLASSAVANYRYKNGTQYENTPDTLTTYNWAWWDSAQQASVAFKPNTGQSTTYTTTYYYDANGHLTFAYVADGRPRSITYVNDANGQVLVRSEVDNKTTGDPKQVWWYFDGKQVGTTGNNGNDDPDYATALTERLQPPASAQGPFRLGSTYGTTFSDFDQAYNSLSPGEGGGSGSTYTVRAGDTLESVARAMFGDASLWYMLADANGLSGAAALSAGQVLRIPAGLANLHNTSDTFRPYDSARHIGDTLPTTPKPPKKPKCGGFGAILLAAVAVAVTLIALPGAAPTFLQGVLAGAAGSAASQAVGLATGIQKKFDFKGLALSALAGGVSAGLGDPDIVGKAAAKFMSADKFFNAAVRGLAASTVTQGLSVATGLQKRFGWAGVAAAGAGAGIGRWVGGGRIVSNVAGGIAASAAQSLVTGEDFGDTLMTNLPGIIGNTIGNIVADAVAGGGQPNPKLVRGGGGGALGLMGASALAEISLPEEVAEIVVYGRKPNGFLNWLDGVLDTNLGGHNPHTNAPIDAQARRRAERFVTYNWPAAQQYRARAILNPEVAATSARLDAQARSIAVAQASAQRQITYGVALAATGPAVAAFGVVTAPASVPGFLAASGAEGAYLGSLTRGAGGGDITSTSIALDAGLGVAGGLAGRYVVAPLAGNVVARSGPNIESEVVAGVRTIHKNSLDYVGDTHVYAIRNADGSLYKVGESAQGVRLSDGASIRAEQQARALRKETGDFYTTEIRQNFGGKADARAYETRFIQTYERLFGQRPPGNPLNR